MAKSPSAPNLSSGRHLKDHLVQCSLLISKESRAQRTSVIAPGNLASDWENTAYTHGLTEAPPSRKESMPKSTTNKEGVFLLLLFFGSEFNILGYKWTRVDLATIHRH